MDAYIQKRYLSDQKLETEALALLGRAPQVGSETAVRDALAMFRRTYDEPVAEDLRFTLWRLGQELYHTPGCRMQQSTVLNNAQKWIRGAWLDTINMPLNDMQWYSGHCLRILKMTDEGERLSAIDTLLHRTDPGEGGLYVDWAAWTASAAWWRSSLGAGPRQLRSAHLFHDMYGLMIRFHGNAGWHNEYPITTRWVHRARARYGTPLRVRLEGLEDGAAYTLQVTYPDMIEAPVDELRVALYAGGKLVHDVIRRDAAAAREPVYRYALPAGAVAGGTLELRWQAYDTLFPVAVSEIWLIRA
jgi:hypothetical protein